MIVIIDADRTGFRRWAWLERLEMWEDQENGEKVTTPEMNYALSENCEFVKTLGPDVHFKVKGGKK